MKTPYVRQKDPQRGEVEAVHRLEAPKTPRLDAAASAISHPSWDGQEVQEKEVEDP